MVLYANVSLFFFVYLSDSTSDNYNNSRDAYRQRLTDSQIMRRKAYGLRADSPTVGVDNNSESQSSKEKTSGNNSLVNSRKRARNETPRMGSVNNTKVLPSSLMGVADDDQDESADEHTALNKRSSPSDIEEDGLNVSTDMELDFHERQRRQNYQLPRRRDSSLGGYGHSATYGLSGGTLPRRRRHAASLTRATTISGTDPLGNLRSACRLGQSMRTDFIPPPPSEPPPATPLSGSIMSEIGSVGAGGISGLLTPFTLQLHAQTTAATSCSSGSSCCSCRRSTTISGFSGFI